MTVIVAFKDLENNRIILGSDGQGTSDDIQLDFGDKILKVPIPVIECEDESVPCKYNDLYVCVSGSHYISQYIGKVFKPPSKLVDEDILDYLYNQFFQGLNNELGNHGLLKVNEGSLESGVGLILVYNDRVFNVYSDFSIVEEVNNFTVHGSGWKIATSVLTNLCKFHKDMDKVRMVKEALLTTSELNIYCNSNIQLEIINL